MQINKAFNAPEIITMVYPDEVMLQGILNPEQTALYRSYMISLQAEAKASSMSNVHQLLLDPASISLEDWCAAHPSAAADADIAAQLSAFILDQIPSWPVSVHPSSIAL